MADTELDKKPDIIAEARKRWERCAEAEDKRRKTIMEVKRFRATKQWPEEIAIERQGGSSLQGQAAQPPRPMITVDRISQPVRQVSNSIRSAHFGIDILPNGFGADDDTAKIFKGYIRRMQNLARTQDPVAWAADQAIEGGIGWFRLRTEYVEPLPSEGSLGVDLFDQELRLERIVNNLAVYSDPNAVMPDRRDMEFAFVTEDIPRSEFKRRWKNADLKGLEDFTSTGDKKWSSWATEDTIRIAEYWRITYTTKRFALLNTGQVIEGKDIPDGAVVKAQRDIPVPQVKMSKITAVQELAEEDEDPEAGKWLGTRIPLFPILGEELNVDGEVVLRGLIQAAMDPQRMLNFSYSAVVEMYSLATKAPWVIAEGQNEGYEAIWQNANRYNYSYLPYKPTSLAGALVGPPQRQTAEPPIQAAVTMCQVFEDAIKATTAIYDPGLGNISQQEKSGKAILALQQQGELTQSHFSANVELAYIAVAEEIVRIMPQITRAGQMLQILGIDDEPQMVVANQPFTMQGNQPVPAPNVPPEAAKMKGSLHKFYDLKAGRYAVTVQVGKSYATRQQEGASMMGDIIMKNPQMLQLIGDIFFRDLNFPGADEISERMKKLLPPQVQEGQDGEPNPQQLMQKLQQMQVLFKHMTDELNAKNHIIETEQVKAQQDLQKEQLKAQSALQEKQIDAQVKLQTAEIQANATLGSAEIKAAVSQAQEELIAHRELLHALLGIKQEAGTQARDHLHELRSQVLEQAHERDLERQKQAHERTLASSQQGHEQDLAGQQQLHEQTLAEQQAEQPETPA